jgi:hypothetical protein
MSDIAASLAASTVTAMGWCCILIAPETTSSKVLRPPATTVTIEGVTARDEPDVRIWLQRRQADKVMTAFFSRCQQARRRPRGCGLVVAAPVTTTEGMLRAVADSLGYSVTDDAVVDEQLALVERRIETQMATMKGTGALKPLNKEYRMLRDAAKAAGATCPARFDLWLVDANCPFGVNGIGGRHTFQMRENLIVCSWAEPDSKGEPKAPPPRAGQRYCGQDPWAERILTSSSIELR